MKSISWVRVTVAILATLVVTTLVISLWYYLAIALPQEASRKNQADADAMYAKVWAAYCHGEPYPTETIRTFCTNPTR